MTTERYLIQEDGDTENGYTWSVIEADGKTAKCLCTCLDESVAHRIRQGLMTFDAMETGRLALAKDGLHIGSDGKPRRGRKQPEWDIEFTPAPKPRRKKI